MELKEIPQMMELKEIPRMMELMALMFQLKERESFFVLIIFDALIINEILLSPVKVFNWFGIDVIVHFLLGFPLDKAGEDQISKE